jgi:hypothetical protein
LNDRSKKRFADWAEPLLKGRSGNDQKFFCSVFLKKNILASDQPDYNLPAITTKRTIDSLAPDELRLFGKDVFSSLHWYRTVCQAGLSPDAHAIFLLARQDDMLLGVLPMLQTQRGLCNLATPYTCFWQPLLAEGLNAAHVERLGEAFGRICRNGAVTRLDALECNGAWLHSFMAGAQREGLKPLWFDHFGNWFCSTVGMRWDEYLAARPGKLRETIKRRTRRLMSVEGAAFTIIRSAKDVAFGLRDYEQVYQKSWKQPEPFPNFNPALMRACAEDGTLRLGMLRLAGEPLAVQFWIVRNGWAGVQKLAHVETARNLAPGTVLTGLMIRHLLDEEHVHELDFGRGDDSYKQDWTGSRRQRRGVLLVNPRRFAGLVAMTRHAAGRLRSHVKPAQSPAI